MNEFKQSSETAIPQQGAVSTSQNENEHNNQGSERGKARGYNNSFNNVSGPESNKRIRETSQSQSIVAMCISLLSSLISLGAIMSEIQCAKDQLCNPQYRGNATFLLLWPVLVCLIIAAIQCDSMTIGAEKVSKEFYKTIKKRKRISIALMMLSVTLIITSFIISKV